MSKETMRRLLDANRQAGSAVGEAILNHMLGECEKRNHLADDNYDPVPRVPLPRAPSSISGNNK